MYDQALEGGRARTRDLALCASFAALVTVGAFIRVPVPVMPFTLQFLFTNMAGLLLGRRLGAAAVGSYIVLGLVGLPVFTGGGGVGYVFQPTFGYILGFLGGAWVAGWIVERRAAGGGKTVGIGTYLAAGFANLAVVYLAGMAYYYMIANHYIHSPIGVRALVFYCFVLAVPGDVLLCIVSGALCRRLRPALYGERA